MKKEESKLVKHEEVYAEISTTVTCDICNSVITIEHTHPPNSYLQVTYAGTAIPCDPYITATRYSTRHCGIHICTSCYEKHIKNLLNKDSQDLLKI